jgi:hypothetical protein
LKRYPFFITSATCRLVETEVEVIGERVGLLFAIIDGRRRESEVLVVEEEEEEVLVVVVVVAAVVAVVEIMLVFVMVGGKREGEFIEMTVSRVVTQ